MKVVMTMMVRDEADIIAAMIEHHLAQGVDLIIATDNASVDGTTEILASYEEAGVLELHHDPVHRKQQHAVVTNMARRAFADHGADWVLNADADEFWFATDRLIRLVDALAKLPAEADAVTVPVVNLVGAPAYSGSGVGRLMWRDQRSIEELLTVGLFAHPTSDTFHRGREDVTVAQGNHFVIANESIQIDSEAIEVLHLPWRSYEQLERKVVNAGQAYAANPDLQPSPNHHGMMDYRSYQQERLLHSYVLRHPTASEIEIGIPLDRYRLDTSIPDTLTLLGDDAIRPDFLSPILDPANDHAIPTSEIEELRPLALQFAAIDRERNETVQGLQDRRRRAVRARKRAIQARKQARRELRQIKRSRAYRLSLRAVSLLPSKSSSNGMRSPKHP
ncbi:MAG: glycosyltransferase family 2 protein [Candidatus Nanopelagicales bacterium]